MAQKVKSWKSLLKLANKDLENYGTELSVKENENAKGIYTICVHHQKVSRTTGKVIWFLNNDFANDCEENQLAETINDAWEQARVKAKEVHHLKRQPKIKFPKVYQAIVAFGSTASSRAADHLWKELAEYHKDECGSLGVRKFNTLAERNAYIMGMNDSLGWEDVYVLDSRETNSLSKHIDLSKLSAPTEC